MLRSLQFPPKFVQSWNQKHAPREMKGSISIEEELRNPAIGGLMRQDSGDVAAFPELFHPAIQLNISDGKPSWVCAKSREPSLGFKCLASEIGSDDDVRKAHSLGYLGMGTGGYLGEKPWAAAGSKGPDGDTLTHRVDLVAKVSRVQRPGGRGDFFPVKL